MRVNPLPAERCSNMGRLIFVMMVWGFVGYKVWEFSQYVKWTH